MMKIKSDLNYYIFIAHYVNPAMGLWFVTCYWVAGMLHYFMVSLEVVTSVLTFISIAYFASFIAYFWFWDKIKKVLSKDEQIAD